MTDKAKRHPVILFPGIAGSRLKTRKKDSQNAHPIWFNGLVLATMHPWSSDDDSAEEGDEPNLIVEPGKSEADLNPSTTWVSPSEIWQNHMKLQDDGITPKVEDKGGEIFNREVEGLDGIRNVHYPLRDNPPDPKNEYYQALVDKLKENGYTENKDLIGHPYDWRVAPGGLEERYQTFSNLKGTIEKLYTDSHLPVVLIAHSMGNRLIQYFLKWIEANVSESKAWIDEHIERYIAISPPWLGAPQAIYRLSDSAILLPAGKSQVGLIGMKDVLQSFSSIPWLLPVTEDNYKYFNTQSFGYYKDDRWESGDLDEYKPVTVQFTLEQAKAQDRTLKYQTDFYQNDPLITDQTTKITGSELIKCPAVKKLDVIYSTGFNTPVGAYYEYRLNELLQKRLKISNELAADNFIPYPHKSGLVIKSGIILETPATEQQIEVDFSNGAKRQNSGDLVVPYGSLTYFKKWQKEEPDRHIVGHEFSAQPTSDGVQYPSVNHNGIVANPDVITRIIQLLSESNA